MTFEYALQVAAPATAALIFALLWYRDKGSLAHAERQRLNLVREYERRLYEAGCELSRLKSELADAHDEVVKQVAQIEHLRADLNTKPVAELVPATLKANPRPAKRKPTAAVKPAATAVAAKPKAARNRAAAK